MTRHTRGNKRSEIAKDSLSMNENGGFFYETSNVFNQKTPGLATPILLPQTRREAPPQAPVGQQKKGNDGGDEMPYICHKNKSATPTKNNIAMVNNVLKAFHRIPKEYTNAPSWFRGSSLSLIIDTLSSNVSNKKARSENNEETLLEFLRHTFQFDTGYQRFQRHFRDDVISREVDRLLVQISDSFRLMDPALRVPPAVREILDETAVLLEQNGLQCLSNDILCCRTRTVSKKRVLQDIYEENADKRVIKRALHSFHVQKDGILRGSFLRSIKRYIDGTKRITDLDHPLKELERYLDSCKRDNVLRAPDIIDLVYTDGGAALEIENLKIEVSPIDEADSNLNPVNLFDQLKQICTCTEDKDKSEFAKRQLKPFLVIWACILIERAIDILRHSFYNGLKDRHQDRLAIEQTSDIVLACVFTEQIAAIILEGEKSTDEDDGTQSMSFKIRVGDDFWDKPGDDGAKTDNGTNGTETEEVQDKTNLPKHADSRLQAFIGEGHEDSQYPGSRALSGATGTKTVSFDQFIFEIIRLMQLRRCEILQKIADSRPVNVDGASDDRTLLRIATDLHYLRRLETAGGARVGGKPTEMRNAKKRIQQHILLLQQRAGLAQPIPAWLQ